MVPSDVAREHLYLKILQNLFKCVPFLPILPKAYSFLSCISYMHLIIVFIKVQLKQDVALLPPFHSSLFPIITYSSTNKILPDLKVINSCNALV